MARGSVTRPHSAARSLLFCLIERCERGMERGSRGRRERGGRGLMERGARGLQDSSRGNLWGCAEIRLGGVSVNVSRLCPRVLKHRCRCRCTLLFRRRCPDLHSHLHPQPLHRHPQQHHFRFHLYFRKPCLAHPTPSLNSARTHTDLDCFPPSGMRRLGVLSR